MSKLDQVLILDPPTDLRFKGPFTDVVTSNLRLKNPSDKRVCFKVKTTAPRRYCVRPNSGVIEPGTTMTISVMLQPFDYDPNEKSKHKFMVQTILAPPNVSDMDALWKDAKATDLMDSKLRCVFDLPPDMNNFDGTRLPPGMDEAEVKKLQEKCKRLESEVNKLSLENRQLQEDTIRLKKRPSSRHPNSNLFSREGGISFVPSLLVVIAAIFMGFFIGKFIL